MRTEQVYYVLETVKTGSFTQAAQNLFLKPPGLRAGINALEEELGYKIFNRHTNGVTLTSQGEKILPKLYEMIQIYEVLKTPTLSNSVSIDEFRISLVPNQYDEIITLKSIKYLHRINPLLRVKFLNSFNPIEQINMVLNHEIDIAQFTISPEQFKNETYQFSQLNRTWALEKVGQEVIVPIVSSTHPLVQKKHMCKLEDFIPYTIILNSMGNRAILNILQQNCNKAKFDVVYLSTSRKEFSEYINYNAIYFCPTSLLSLEEYAKLTSLHLEKEIIFDNCLAYRIDNTNPFLPIYKEFLCNEIGPISKF